MGDDALAWASARELHRLVVARQVTPVEIVTACLSRIDRLDPTLHASITVAGDGALDDARGAEAAVLRAASPDANGGGRSRRFRERAGDVSPFVTETVTRRDALELPLRASVDR